MFFPFDWFHPHPWFTPFHPWGGGWHGGGWHGGWHHW
jgi:hypothetical protein